MSPEQPMDLTADGIEASLDTDPDIEPRSTPGAHYSKLIDQAGAGVGGMSPDRRALQDLADAALDAHLATLINACARSIGVAHAISFSDTGRQAIREAWRFAASMEHRAVTPLHLFTAMPKVEPDAAASLGALAACDARQLRIGALTAATVSLGNAVAPPRVDHLLPVEELLRWLAAAADGGTYGTGPSPVVSPQRLADVLQPNAGAWRGKDSIRRRLSQASRIGRPTAAIARTDKGVDNTRTTLGFFKADMHKQMTWSRRRLKKLDDGLERLSVGVSDAARRSDIDKINESIGALASRIPMAQDLPADEGTREVLPVLDNASAVGSALSRKMQEIADRQTQDNLAHHDRTDAIVREGSQASVAAIAAVAAETAALRDALPRPPSALWLTLAAVSVAALGIATAFAVSDATTAGVLLQTLTGQHPMSR
ncbi:MAG: hypothetical protein NW205_13055 [Hyphomicrobiaceae bacterium]|nr:hypothetical protein [Hyphomicrobiaceae bacterium]